MNQKAVNIGWNVLLAVISLIGVCIFFTSWLALPDYLETRWVMGKNINTIPNGIMLASYIAVVLLTIIIAVYACKKKTNKMILYFALGLSILIPIIGSPLFTFFLYGKMDLYGIVSFFINILCIQLFSIFKCIGKIKGTIVNDKNLSLSEDNI